VTGGHALGGTQLGNRQSSLGLHKSSLGLHKVAFLLISTLKYLHQY
jgi:hypothetical protein